MQQDMAAETNTDANAALCSSKLLRPQSDFKWANPTEMQQSMNLLQTLRLPTKATRPNPTTTVLKPKLPESGRGPTVWLLVATNKATKVKANSIEGGYQQGHSYQGCSYQDRGYQGCNYQGRGRAGGGCSTPGINRQCITSIYCWSHGAAAVILVPTV